MGRLIILAIVGFFAFQYIWGDESGCDKYSSKYSCDYVENIATYDVYYWKNVRSSTPEDEEFIGSTTGLSTCRKMAVNYSKILNEEWNNRSYICMLKKDGKNMEKHRL